MIAVASGTCLRQVEHFFAFFKRFQIVAGVYRGRLGNPRTAQSLADTCKIILHVSAIYLRANPLRVHHRLIGPPASDDESDLDEIKVVDLPAGMAEPEDDLVDSGNTIADFAAGFAFVAVMHHSLVM